MRLFKFTFVLFIICLYRPAFNQIIYHEFDSLINVLSYPDVFIDFNDDEIIDLRFFHGVWKESGCDDYLPWTNYICVDNWSSNDTNCIIVDIENNAILYNNEDTIKETTSAIQFSGYSEDIVLLSKIYYYYDGCTQISVPEFSGLGEQPFINKFLAFRISLNNNFHYCWLKISKEEGFDLNIHSFAYNSIPDSTLVINDPNPTYVSIFKNKFETIGVYPNPFNEQLVIKSGLDISSIKIFNISGRLIQSYSYTESKIISLNTEEWTTGLYLINIILPKSSIAKVIIKH